jgi:ATP-dependent helicase/nuclease subunit A
MSRKTAAYSVAEALNPEASVFVSANAGAGKTSLLTSRVLRLLLHGTPPSRILCITFTNAAAAEMLSRVQAELGKWVMGSDAEVREALAGLMEAIPDDAMLARARSLFAAVLEAPEGIRIQTIHGFCQSLLKRFPIEAGISPHFSVMDGRTEQELLQEARFRLFSRAQQHEELQESLQVMARNMSESGIHSLFGDIIQHKRKFRSLLAQPGGVGAIIDTVEQTLQVPHGATLQSLIDTHFVYDDKMLAQWRQIIGIFQHSDHEKAETIGGWFAAKEQRVRQLDRYIAFFLTQKGEQRARMFKKDVITDQGLIELCKAEQERVWRFHDARKALDAAHNTAHMLHVTEAFLALYESLKQARALMDYDDLILTARDLLQKSKMTQWVLFKLDGGIDCILVDEAQDTSLEQWSIVDALTKEFFSGSGQRETDRSLFVVGDEKQSIYSFQGADPSALGRMQGYFFEAIKSAGKPVYRVALTHSFRSTGEVLTAVDTIFAQPAAREGLMFNDADLAHIPTRLEHPGLVEVWPLIEGADEEISAATKLARNIAEIIHNWIDAGTAQPGDIMILVRNRNTLVDRMVRALKRRGVSVAGHDRMQLNENLAVQDLIALGQCLLLPDDDLTLASILKSPIFNVSEEELFYLAYGRGKKSLWERLSASQRCTSAFALLTELRGKADFISPYALYSWLIDTNGARRRFAGRMGEETYDSIDEFLGQALLYEHSHPPSLQGFLHWLTSSDSEIKRDMEQARDSVRIMTVHGAKGLQAPIVILPDTVEVPKVHDSILWQEGEQALPFWPVSTGKHDAFCASLYDGHKQAMLAEYRRLLYVALTRAEDRLYICGATNKEKISEHSWYHMVRTGLAPLTKEFETGWGKGLRMGTVPARGQQAGRRRAIEPVQPLRTEHDWDFLTKAAPVEPVPSKPLSPSRLSDPEPASASPLSATTVYQRGNLIHKLLQYVPEVAKSERQRVAQQIASGSGHSMSEDVVEKSIRETLAIIDNPKFSFLFGAGSLAEAPVAGCVDVGGKTVAVSGQIDRLFIDEKNVWIIDFKSNREVPERIPAAYLKQMQLYRLLLKRIYPKKAVSCALLWTSVPRFEIIDVALLDEVPSSSYI